MGSDAKTDPIDAKLIAYYCEVVNSKPAIAKSPQEKDITALVVRRRQILKMISMERNRLGQIPVRPASGQTQDWRRAKFRSPSALHVGSGSHASQPPHQSALSTIIGCQQTEKVSLGCSDAKVVDDSQHVDQTQ